MVKRILFDICVLISVVLLPIWTTALLVFAGVVLFQKYFEGLVFLAIPVIAYEEFISIYHAVVGTALLVLIWARTSFGVKYLKKA